MKERSLWEKGAVTLPIFERGLEQRTPYYPALQHAYKALAKQYLGDDNVLFLGVGIGQEVEMMGIEHARVTGIDLSQEFIPEAKRRIPGATFIVGDIVNVLSDPAFPSFPATVACNTLDCLPPSILPEALAAVRAKTESLVTVSDFTGHFEFYGVPQGKPQEKFASPGYRSWGSELNDVMTHDLSAKGITPIRDASQMLGQIQEFVSSTFAKPLELSLPQLIRTMRFPLHKFPVAQVAQLPLYAQALHLVDTLGDSLKRYMYSFSPLKSQQEAAEYLQAVVAENYALLCKRTLQLSAFMTHLAGSLEHAGFSTTNDTVISANQKGVISEESLVDNLNHAFNLARVKRFNPRFCDTLRGYIYVNGADLKLLLPSDETITSARIQAKIAA